MDHNELETLIGKYQKRTIRSDESERLNEWYHSYDDHTSQVPATDPRKLERLWSNMSTQIEKKSRRRTYTLIGRVAAVAVVLIGMAVTLSLYFAEDSLNEPLMAQEEILMPAEGVATLELSTGKKVSLETPAPASQANEIKAVNNSQEKLLDYSQEPSAKETPQEIIYNTIHVPAGGEYKVVLADGTKVHLNSCSSLKYPVQFAGDQREVQLMGEAFFEVSKGEKPFIVKTSAGVDVRVYGTSFNVNAYENQKQLVTALVSGKVRVIDKVYEQTYDMVPGVALTYEKYNGDVHMEKADLESILSWTTGKFVFNDMRLEDILLKLERWYGVSVHYDNDFFKNRRLSGALEKNKPLNDLLDIFQKVTQLQFHIEDKNITISKPRNQR